MDNIYKRINIWNTFISFFYFSMKKIIAGVDEVGRGSLIGPVYAAAVIFNPKINKKEIKDSKKLKKIEREKLSKYIKKKFYLGYWISIN